MQDWNGYHGLSFMSLSFPAWGPGLYKWIERTESQERYISTNPVWGRLVKVIHKFPDLESRSCALFYLTCFAHRRLGGTNSLMSGAGLFFLMLQGPPIGLSSIWTELTEFHSTVLYMLLVQGLLPASTVALSCRIAAALGTLPHILRRTSVRTPPSSISQPVLSWGCRCTSGSWPQLRTQRSTSSSSTCCPAAGV
jgi:hypothetical protein